MVEAVLEDEFPTKFGIYDLNQFLGNVTTLKNPELTFHDNPETVDLFDGETTFNYKACSPNLVTTPPDKELNLKSVDVKFTLTNAALQKLLRLASMNSLPNLSVIGKDGELCLVIHERSNDTSNQGTTKLGEYTGKNFTAAFKTENLKVLPDDYTVEIQEGAFAKFHNLKGTLTYFIAVENK